MVMVGSHLFPHHSRVFSSSSSATTPLTPLSSRTAATRSYGRSGRLAWLKKKVGNESFFLCNKWQWWVITSQLCEDI
jgi:hypothetical protein